MNIHVFCKKKKGTHFKLISNEDSFNQAGVSKDSLPVDTVWALVQVAKRFCRWLDHRMTSSIVEFKVTRQRLIYSLNILSNVDLNSLRARCLLIKNELRVCRIIFH